MIEIRHCHTGAILRTVVPPPDNAFIRACRGPDPDVSALAWLEYLLGCVDYHFGAIPTEDREALFAALRHSQTLLTRLREAMQQTREVAP